MSDARNSSCNSPSEQSGLTPSKMKRHRHPTVFEWYASSGVVSYIHLDRVEVRVQHRHVVNVSEPIRYRCAVTSANWEGSLQRGDTVTDYARLHDVRIDVDGIEPLLYVHHVFGLFTVVSLFGSKTTLADAVGPMSVPPSLG